MKRTAAARWLSATGLALAAVLVITCNNSKNQSSPTQTATSSAPTAAATVLPSVTSVATPAAATGSATASGSFPAVTAAAASASATPGGTPAAESALEPATPAPVAAVSPLDAGDYGYRQSDAGVAVSLNAVEVRCQAPTLLAIQTQEDTFYFQLQQLPDLGCEQIRAQLLATVGGSAGSVAGKKVGVHFEKLAEAILGSEYSVTVVWENLGAATFNAVQGFHAGKPAARAKGFTNLQTHQLAA